MNKTWAIIIALCLFIIFTFIYWKITKGYVKDLYGKKMWMNWGNKTYYWTNVLFVSGGLTVLVFSILKSTNILSI